MNEGICYRYCGIEHLISVQENGDFIFTLIAPDGGEVIGIANPYTLPPNIPNMLDPMEIESIQQVDNNYSIINFKVDNDLGFKQQNKVIMKWEQYKQRLQKLAFVGVSTISDGGVI
ncbi:hypothetical protein WOSG25_050330 [Weissella oryzae SG25]|uniref:Uncharacterized protein n=1 Tax=Weissella oryzae (strain DSM 25784 / JCM 18191 / LMG 30913 / SG25) TaxID=1329250 RepID=A0A069D0C0_WEIOS|nr:hypothetical protein [Weissella oryzae]GAK30761.1 hypothetical protein WOSG25_050330 [Weissella oryzae SG25]